MMANQTLKEMPYSIEELVKARVFSEYSPYLIRAALKQAGKTEYGVTEAKKIIEAYAKKGA